MFVLDAVGMMGHKNLTYLKCWSHESINSRLLEQCDWLLGTVTVLQEINYIYLKKCISRESKFAPRKYLEDVLSAMQQFKRCVIMCGTFNWTANIKVEIYDVLKHLQANVQFKFNFKRFLFKCVGIHYHRQVGKKERNKQT